MRKVIYKLFWVWQFDREEKWLNEMAAKGLSLVAIGPAKYTFEETMPGEYYVRSELLDKLPRHPESEACIRFIEETGAEYLGAWTRWVYFRKKSSLGKFAIHDSLDAKIKHLNRLLVLLFPLALANMAAFATNIMNYLSSGIKAALFFALFSLLVALGCSYGAIMMLHKKYLLKKEKQIFE